MARKPGFYWAWDEDETPQPVECHGNGKVSVLGVDGAVNETHFVYIEDEPITQPVFGQ